MVESITIEEFNTEFETRINYLIIPTVLRPTHKASNKTSLGYINFIIKCKLNNLLYFVQGSFKDSAYLNNATVKDMFDTVFLENSVAIREWATSIRNNATVLGTYIPTTEFNTMVLAEFNKEFEVIITKYELSSKNYAENILINFSIRHISTNNYIYGKSCVPITKLDADILDTAWDSINKNIEESTMVLLNNKINVGSIMIPNDFSTTAENTTLTTRISPAIHGYFNYINITDSKSIGTNGGSFIKDTWVTRYFNNIETDIPQFIVLNTGDTSTFTLSPGTYSMHVICPAYNVLDHQARLYNHTTSTVDKYGTQTYCNFKTTESIISHNFLISVPTEFSIQHTCSRSQNGDGLGRSDGNTSELYSSIKIKKLLFNSL
jgi:hypothetical protein